MRMRRVPNHLQVKVIKWFDYLWLTQKCSDEEKAVSCLPGEFANQTFPRTSPKNIARSLAAKKFAAILLQTLQVESRELSQPREQASFKLL